MGHIPAVEGSYRFVNIWAVSVIAGERDGKRWKAAIRRVRYVLGLWALALAVAYSRGNREGETEEVPRALRLEYRGVSRWFLDSAATERVDKKAVAFDEDGTERGLLIGKLDWGPGRREWNKQKVGAADIYPETNVAPRGLMYM